MRTKELVFSLAMKKHFLYLISFKYSFKKMQWLRGKIDDAAKTLKERDRFSLTCLLAVYNLFIHGVCVLNHCLEGLDHLQRKHPDRRSHGQLDAGGSLLGPGPPPAIDPPPDILLRFTGKVVRPCLPTQALRPDCEECLPKEVTLDVTPRASMKLSPFQHDKRSERGRTSDPLFTLNNTPSITLWKTATPKRLTLFTQEAFV